MSIQDFLFLFVCLLEKMTRKPNWAFGGIIFGENTSANVILCCSVAACFHVVALLSCYLCPLGDKHIVCQRLDAAGGWELVAAHLFSRIETMFCRTWL